MSTRHTPGTPEAIEEANTALERAARQLSDMPDLQNDLMRFCDYWPTIGAYTPPAHVDEAVINIVHGFVAAARAYKDNTK